MRSGIQLAAQRLDYDANNRIILTTLAVLKTLSAEALQQRYERANP